jgi:purine-binding chemotaxis protein CheW
MARKVSTEDRNARFDSEGKSGRRERTLVFKMCGANYSLELELIREVMKPVEVTRVPFMAGFLEGVVNFRGNIVPIIDLSAAALDSKSTRSKKTRFLIAELKSRGGEELVGLIVDEVIGARTLKSEKVPSDDMLPLEIAIFARGLSLLDGRMIVHLDIASLLLAKKEILNRVAAFDSATQGQIVGKL